MDEQALTRIAAAVSRSAPVNGLRIVGVDGPSGSGKSWLAARLSAAMGAPVVEIDDFVSWDCFSGWWPRFDAQVLTPLLEHRPAVYQVRDWTDWYGSSLGGWKTQPWAPTMIFEGVTCTRRESVGRIAYAIWVEADPQLRLARGLARDTAFPASRTCGNGGWPRRTPSSRPTEPATGLTFASTPRPPDEPR